MPPWFWVLISLFLIGNVIGLFAVGIHPDEAYYWVWSEKLQAGYFDHPPMVAWEIRLFTSILGDHPWVIRLPAVLAWVAINISVYLIARETFPRFPRAGWLAVLVATSLPLYQVGFHIVTPDSPYLLFTALSFWAITMALTRDPRWWLLTGLFGGLSLLGKYMAVLFPAAVLFGLIISKEGRKQLLTPWPWLAVFIAAIVFSPVIYWNAQHDWISFLFQLGHGINLKGDASVVNVLLYMAGQLVMAMPWVFIAMIVAAVKTRSVLSDRKPVYGVLLLGFGLPLIFFAFTGFRMISGANWPAAAYIPGSVLLGGLLAQWPLLNSDRGSQAKNRQYKWLVTGIVVAGLLSMLLANATRYRGNTQLAFTFGWPETAAVVKEIHDEQSDKTGCVIVTEDKLLTAALAFALNMPHRVLALVPYRMRDLPVSKTNQYDVWREQDKYQSQPDACVMVIMSENSGNFPQRSTTIDGTQWQLERVHEVPSPVRTRWAGIYIRANVRTD